MDNKLSQQQMLEAIKQAYQKKMGEGQVGNRMPAIQDGGFNIAPEKPDPERDANRLIDAASSGRMPAVDPSMAPAPGRSPSVNSMVEARSANPINPETGMPFYSAPDASAEDPQDAERREIRMRLLQEASKTGRMPAYLQKK